MTLRPVAAAAATAALLLAGCAPAEVGKATQPRSVYVAARADLASVATVDSFPPDSMTGYDRSCSPGRSCVFGAAWTDRGVGVALARNGCDTRNDVLGRDLTDVRRRGRCKVLSGRLDDPYTGQRIDFSAQDPQAVQIDHVLALAYAWRGGARGWTQERRTAFANDPDNLRAVSGAANQDKGDRGPKSWLPPNLDHRCAYAATWAKVARKYGVRVLAADWRRADDLLQECQAAARPDAS